MTLDLTTNTLHAVYAICGTVAAAAVLHFLDKALGHVAGIFNRKRNP